MALLFFLYLLIVRKNSRIKYINSSEKSNEVTSSFEILKEKKLEYRYKFSELIREISQKIISTKNADIDSAIEYSLSEISQFENVERSYIALFDNELNEISHTHEWCAPGIKSKIDENQNVWFNVYPGISELIKSFKTFTLNSIEDLSPQYSKDKIILNKQGISALLMIPMMHEKELLGVLGFETYTKSKNWEEEFIIFAKMITNIIANALMRKAYVLILKESEERHKLLSDITFEGIAIFHEGLIIDCNKSFLKLFKLKRSDVIERNPIKDYFNEKDYIRIEHCINSSIEEKKLFIVEMRQSDKKMFKLEVESKILKADKAKYRVLSFRDVTSRVKAEEDLRESELKFRTFNDNIKGAVLTYDESGRFNYVNNEMCNISEYTRDELLQMFFWDIIHPDQVAIVKQRGMSRLAGKVVTAAYELMVVAKSGKVKWVEVTGSKLVISGVNYVLGTGIEITDRKEKSQALKESEEKYRLLSDKAPYGILVHSDYIIEYANDAAASILEVESPRSLIGVNIMKLVPKYYEKAVFERINEIYTERSNAPLMEEKLWTFSGKLIDAEVSANYIVFNGKPASQVIMRDVTSQKEDQQQVRKLSSAIDKSPASVSITDEKGVIQYVNPMFTEVTGYYPEEVIGRTHSILNSGKHDTGFYKDLWETISAGKVWQGEIFNKKKNGKFYWAEESISSLYSNDGQITHFISVWQDISDRKQLHDDLINAKNEAEEMSRIKSNFLATMSHELRTPLIGILGFAEILYTSLEDNNFKEMAEVINNSGQRLLETLNSILDLSVLESRQLDVNIVDIDVKEVLLEVKKLYIANANKKNIYLIIDFKTENTSIRSDERHLRQVFNNILNNAIKYTNEGGVIVEVSMEKDNGKDSLVIEFRDTGIGISKENIQVIFEEFRQASEGYNREFEGSGLGLHICKRYLDEIGGNIEVKSEPNNGSVFKVKLPYKFDLKAIVGKRIEKTAKRDEKSSDNALEIKPSNILLVEDEPTNRKYVSLILDKLNLNLDTANNGFEAIALANKKKYDLVLMDINLGKDLNGIETMKEIKNKDEYKDVPFIAITANAMQGHKEEFMSEGFTDYLSKPFNAKQIRELLARMLND
ncbi:PAS domain S-box protein [Bacteroidota bacterium]